MLPTQLLVIRVMGDTTLATAVDDCPATTAKLKLHLPGRLVQLVKLAGRVGASNELPGQLHVHPIVQSQRELGHSQALIEAELDEEVYIRTLACLCSVGVVQTLVHPCPGH